MIGALWNGFSGLTTFDSAIAVESTNSSNTTTVGHKSDELRFEDMFYSARGIGNGVQSTTVQKNFAQGELQVTTVSTDVAIEGKGFFRVQDRVTNEIFYTRAGNFQKAGDGYLETQENRLVFGLAPQNKILTSTSPNDTMFTSDFTNNVISIDMETSDSLYNTNVKTTDYEKYATDIGTSGDNFKTKTRVIANVEILSKNYIDKLKLYQTNPQVTSVDVYNNGMSIADFSSYDGQLVNDEDFLSVQVGSNTYKQKFDKDFENTLDLLAGKISSNEGLKVDEIDGKLIINKDLSLTTPLSLSASINSIDPKTATSSYNPLDSTLLDFSNYENPLNNVSDVTIKDKQSLTISFGKNIYTQNFDTDFKNTLTLLADQISAGEGITADVDTLNGAIILEDYIPSDNFIQTSASISSQSQTTEIDYSSLLSQLEDENDSLAITINNITYRQNFDMETYNKTLNKDEAIASTLKLFSDKISDINGFDASVDENTGLLVVKSIVPGKNFTVANANINEQYIPIVNTQEATSGFGELMVEDAKQSFKDGIELANARYLEITNVLTSPENAQLSETPINLSLDFNGLVDNAFGNLQVSGDGLVYLVDGENSFLISKIQTAHFINEQGLEAVGGNIFKKTEESGDPLNADGLNNLIPSSLEQANVNYSSSLSSLLIYQKAFEANSKSITVSDEFVKTAIDMKK